MGVTLDLLFNAITSGLLLGGFYAAVSVGVAISFGMLDIANLAHPAFIILGSFTAYILNGTFGMDPIVAGIVVLPGFLPAGRGGLSDLLLSFERRGEESLRGLAFFFGILFITEVTLILIFGVDYRFVEAPYIGPTLRLGIVDLPLRMLVPCVCSLIMVGGLQLSLSHTFLGRAILAVSQDGLALRLLAINPSRVKLVAFASRSRLRQSPAPSSSSSSRSSRRSAASISAASSPSASWAAWGAFRACSWRRCCSASSRASPRRFTGHPGRRRWPSASCC